MNLHTHRITTDADAEAWADAQVSRRQATQQYHPLGVTNQGRHNERAHPVEEAVTETKVTDGAHASSELLEDAAQQQPDPWVSVFKWGAVAVIVVWVCFWVFMWRAAQ